MVPIHLNCGKLMLIKKDNWDNQWSRLIFPRFVFINDRIIQFDFILLILIDLILKTLFSFIGVLLILRYYIFLDHIFFTVPASIYITLIASVSILISILVIVFIPVSLINYYCVYLFFFNFWNFLDSFFWISRLIRSTIAISWFIR
jgi:hypothetical protein